MSIESVMMDRNHYLISPNDPAQRVICEKVEQACRAALMQDYKIRLNPGYTTTIAAVYTESLIRVLVSLMRENNGEASLNFLDLFTLESTNRENDDADKDGNINIKFIPGPTIETIMERDYAPVIEPEQWHKTLVELSERQCGKILTSKHHITTNTPTNWTKIAYVYLQYLFRTLKLLTRTAYENGKEMAMINFLEMFEAHGIYQQIPNEENPELVREHIEVKIRPGFQAKLLIKDDGTTERFGDDDDD